MQIDITLHPGNEPIAIMRLHGEIDASNFILVSYKAQELYMNPARNLIIDLSDVPGISSTGLAAIHKIALLYSGMPQNVQENANPISPTAAAPASMSSSSIPSRKWIERSRVPV